MPVTKADPSSRRYAFADPRSARHAVFFAVPEVEDELPPFTEIDGHAAEEAGLRGVDLVGDSRVIPGDAVEVVRSDIGTLRPAIGQRSGRRHCSP